MKNNKKIYSKVLACTLATTIGVTAFSPTASVFAAEKTENTYSQDFSSLNFENIDRTELYSLGFTDVEIDELLLIPTTGITLNNGVAYDQNGNIIEGTERGKFTWAVKALRKAFNKLPNSVQAILGGATFNKLLNFIEHFTGAIEDAVYEGMRSLGFNHSTSWMVTKTLMLFL